MSERLHELGTSAEQLRNGDPRLFSTVFQHADVTDRRGEKKFAGWAPPKIPNSNSQLQSSNVVIKCIVNCTYHLYFSTVFINLCYSTCPESQASQSLMAGEALCWPSIGAISPASLCGCRLPAFLLGLVIWGREQGMWLAEGGT